MGLFFKSKREKEMELYENLIYRSDRKEPGAFEKLCEVIAIIKPKENFEETRKKLYLRLAKQGDAFAEFQLGKIASDPDLKTDPQEAVYWYSESAKKGNADAMFELGLGYTKFYNESEIVMGWGFDPSKALYWLNEASSHGNAAACYWICDAYEYGYGVEQNIDVAYQWCKKGADNGDIRCKEHLADGFYDNPIYKKYYDKGKAIRQLEQLMNTDDPEKFRMTAKTLAYKYNSVAWDFTADTDTSYDPQKAAYCALLACVLSDDHDMSQLLDIKYRISRYEADQWKIDAVNLDYNIERF